MFASASDDRRQVVMKTTPQPSSVDQFYCKLCDIQCTGVESYRNHTSGCRHCKKFLTKQNDLGFDEFEHQFKDVPFNKRCGNVPPPSPREQYALQVYRSGLANKFSCKACGANTFQMLKWFEHVYSYEHGQKMQSLQSSISRALFLNQFGDLPGPNPTLFTPQDERTVQQNAESKLASVHAAGQDGLEYQFSLNLDSLTKPQSSIGSSSRSDTNLRSPSELPSNHPPRQNGHVSPSGDATYQPQNRRVLRRHHQHLDEDDDDKHDGRKRMKAVRIKESPIMRRSYSPPHEHIAGHWQNNHRYSSQSHDERVVRPSSRYEARQSDEGRVKERLKNGTEERRHHTSPIDNNNNNNRSSYSSSSFSMQSMLNCSTSSDGILRETLREFLSHVTKRQPPRSDKTPSDDRLFRSLSTSEQRHLLNIHALTNDDSVWRCYGAVKFLRALDPQLLTAVSRLVDQPAPSTAATASRTASRTSR